MLLKADRTLNAKEKRCTPLLNVGGEKPNKENDCSADKFQLCDTSDESVAGIIKRKNNRNE